MLSPLYKGGEKALSGFWFDGTWSSIWFYLLPYFLCKSRWFANSIWFYLVVISAKNQMVWAFIWSTPHHLKTPKYVHFWLLDVWI